jgi:DNA polymerase III epsilon subunit-like protein
MRQIYSTMPHLQGHLLCAIDFETTGARPGYHEPIQIAVVPLNSDLRPAEGIRPFYTNIRPLFPERAEPAATRVHKLDLNYLCQHALEPDRVADLFREWFENLDMPFQKVIVPLAHNWAFEYGFLGAWLGIEGRDKIFHAHARDAMTIALGKNDTAFFRGETPPFDSYVSLTHLCRHFGIVNPRPHDALCDCLAEAEVYRHLLNMDMI